MEAFLIALVNKLYPSHIVFLVCGYGAWRIAQTFIGKFIDHSDKIADSLSHISTDCSEMRKDLAVIVSRVDDHSRRIDVLEDKTK